MSTLELENIKHPDNSGNNLTLAADGSIGSLNLSGNMGIGTNTPLTAPSGTFSWANPIATIEGSRPTLYLNGSGSLATIRMWPSGNDGSSTTLDDFHINAIATSGSTPGSLVFAAQGGAIGAGLSINSNNIVTTPDNPAFSINGDTDPNWTSDVIYIGHTGSGAAAYDTNIGNHFSYTNGKFTAPVAGSYFFSFRATTNDTNSHFIDIHKNGARVGGHTLTYGNSYITATNTVVLTLAVGDYIEARRRAAGYSLYSVNFSGFLIG